MNWMMNILPEATLQALGWTFIDSIWQGLLISTSVFVLVQLLKIKSASTKYWINAIGMVLILVCAVTSFTYHSANATTDIENVIASNPINNIIHVSGVNEGLSASYQYWMASIEPMLPWLVGFWIIGALVFTVRLMGGLYYIRRLKAKAVLVNSEIWLDKLDQLKLRLGIDRAVSLMESSMIDVPMVAGHLKPILLIPIGLFTNLSPNQVETLLLHELSHIKRHDYLINMIQSALEVILFFNPAVWYLSGQVRKERELCCDDMAVAAGVDAMDYARALTLIQQSYINNKNSLAMALAKNNNQLLVRIKRLLGTEMTTQGHSWYRLFIIILLAGGLFGFSWFNNSDNPAKIENEIANSSLDELVPLQPLRRVAPDTTILEPEEVNENSSQSQIVWKDEEGNVMEYVEETYEPVEPDFNMAFATPNVDVMVDVDPDMDVVVEVDPNVDVMVDIDPDVNVNVDIDPDVMVDQMLSQFDHDFMNSLNINFNDTFPSNDFDEQRVMMQMQEDMRRVFEEQKRAMHELQLNMEKLHSMNFDKMDEKEIKKQKEKMELIERRMHDKTELMEKMLKQKQEVMHQHQFSLREAQEGIRKAEKEIAAQEGKIMEMEKNMKAYEKELVKELKKDGYLKGNEDLNNFSITNGDRMEVNGKQIKDEDVEKYDRLRKEFFGDE